MDELDNEIVRILQRNGRASNAGVARDVGVSEGTVRRRLKRLVQGEFIQVVALPDPTKMGEDSQALIGVQVDPDKIDQVADDLAKLEEVSWVSVTTGSRDIYAWATLPSAKVLGIFLRTKVGTIPGVRHTETFVNLAIRKKGYGIVV